MQNRVQIVLNNISGKILDVGHSCGTLHQRIRENFPQKNIFGLDTEEKKNSEHYKKGSAEKIPFGKESFDSVVAGELIEHLEKPEAFLREANRVLKKKGTIVLTTPNKKSFINRATKSYYTKVHLSLFDKKELLALLKNNGFEIKKFTVLPYTAESSDGAHHKKLFALRKGIHFVLPQGLQEEMIVVAKKVKE